MEHEFLMQLSTQFLHVTMEFSILELCCIMSEVEIHVISTPQCGIDSVAVSVCGLGEGDSPCRKVVVDVSPSSAPSTSTVKPGASMQKDEARLQMEEELADDGLDEEIDEIDVFPKHLPPMFPSGSRPETPVTISTGTGTSPPIPIPLSIPSSFSTLGGGPPGSGSLVGTPTRSFSFNYLYRLASPSPDNVSPLSSGYGSAPRFFSSTSTQTPPLSPVLMETQIRLRLFNSPTSSSSSPNEQSRCRGQRLTQESRGRGRFFSEGHDASDQPTPGSEPDNPANAEPLPDVIAFRRDRANSAPARPVRPEIMAGRELRRIGDEFVSLFEDQRSLRRAAPNRRSFIRRFLDSLSENMTTPEPSTGKTSPRLRDGSSV